MRADTFAEVLIGGYVLYEHVIRPRRYGYFLAKCLLALVLFIPAFALMSADWRNDYQVDVTIAVLVASAVCVGPWIVSFDPFASWRSIAKQVGFLLLGGTIAMFGVMYWQMDGVDPRHLRFMLRVPGIVTRYIVRLPRDGPLLAHNFCQTLSAAFFAPKAPVPPIPVVNHKGVVIANLTSAEA